jgi:hypothetical protein
MLQVTSARHVLRRDPAAAEDALRSAEEVGRRSMQELRRTVALLRSADDTGVAPPVPSAADIPALVEQARSGGLDVELRSGGDLSKVAPTVGVALYRISQEALANAARHAPKARTVLGIDVAGGRASLVAEDLGRNASHPKSLAGVHLPLSIITHVIDLSRSGLTSGDQNRHRLEAAMPAAIARNANQCALSAVDRRTLKVTRADSGTCRLLSIRLQPKYLFLGLSLGLCLTALYAIPHARFYGAAQLSQKLHVRFAG